MASLVLTGDTSGQVTISAPAVAGTTTLTLPATSGTVLNDATVGVCRAWVNFNGTGTVAIRASFNVSSITDNATGNYSINFTTAMTDANYSGSFCGNGLAQIPVFYVTSTSSLQVLYYNTAGTPVDNSVCVASVFR